MTSESLLSLAETVCSNKIAGGQSGVGAIAHARNARHRWIYISCGEGALNVLQKQGDGYREIGRIPTISGARTSLWVPKIESTVRDLGIEVDDALATAEQVDV